MKHSKKYVHSYTQFLIFLIGVFIGVSSVVFLTKLKKNSIDSSEIDSDGWSETGIHFNFAYPDNWHVYLDGSTFYIDDRPIIRFPHQPQSNIFGYTLKDSDIEQGLISLNGDYKPLPVDTTPEMKDNISCYENDEELSDIPLTEDLHGKTICFVSVPWDVNYSIVYKIEAKNTNVSENRAVFLRFIKSITPVNIDVNAVQE